MTVLLQFDGVACPDLARPYSFSLNEGDARLLKVASEAEKDAVIGVALGKRRCTEGVILVQGVPLDESRPGCIGWVAANGGLISNLKVWENVTLPLWYHGKHTAAETEQRVAQWLSVLGMVEADREPFMASPPDRLLSLQRKLAGLMRALVQSPLVLVVDSAVFKGVDPRMAAVWETALERYAAQGGAVLAVSDDEAALPWKIIE
ncbi:MAG TPA: ATP-binding cassette domain-containing protein [Gallionella sp.]|nr:ATP-binding cassette domain-containing protein [Gallionella sp.]